MKRSEMVALIELEVNNRIVDAYSYWDEYTASDFLSILENAGMLPPIVISNAPENEDQSYWEPEE